MSLKILFCTIWKYWFARIKKCWTPEGITKYKTVVLRYYLLQTTPHENTEEFKNKAVVANSINGRYSGLDETHEFNCEEGNSECSPEGYSEMQQL